MPPRFAGPTCQHALECAERIPPGFVERFYLEDHGGDRPQDFIASVPARGSGGWRGPYETLIQRLGGDVGGSPAWRDVAALMRSWRSGHLPGTGRIWLEYDARVQRARVPREGREGDRRTPPGLAAPGIFLDLATAALRGRAASVLAGRLVARMASRAHTRRALAGVLDALPQHAAIPYVGLFSGRRPATLRICLMGMEASALVRFLHRAGWPGSIFHLQESLRYLDHLWTGAPDARHAAVHLDLAPGLRPGIGLEYGLERRPQLRGHIAERAFLDRLVEAGLLAPDAYRRCVAWPTASVRGGILVARWINHVKCLVGHGDPQLRVKAYLAGISAPRPSSDRAVPPRNGAAIAV